MADSLADAGECLGAYVGAPSFLERYLEEALVNAIGASPVGASATPTGHGTAAIPNWDRRLGGFDLRVRLEAGLRGEALVETKVDDVEHTLWDLFKVAAGLTMPDVEAGYLVLARLRHRWNDGDCAALFAEGDGPTRWVSAAMFGDWRSAWADLTGPRGGSARPLTVPAEIETHLIGTAPASGFDGYAIRAVAVRLIRGAGDLEFDGSWPTPSRGS